jgi:DNA polymerase-1
LPKFNPKGIDGETLHKLVKAGHTSPVLHSRLKWAEAEGFRRYAASIAEKDRVHPNFLPTQAVGRWSVTDPPLINFPDDAKADKNGLPRLRSLFLPDPGTYWLCWDWDALHAKFMAGMSDDQRDIDAFNQDWDVHTLTCCSMFHLPVPPSPIKKEIMDGASCASWRKLINWAGDGDRRRHLAKTVRYSLLNALDEKGVLESKDVEAQGLTMADLLKAAKAFLAAKPNMVKWKEEFARDAIAAGWSRSLYGRRRVLLGSDYDMKFKEAISHFLQGTEVDILEETMITILRDTYPQARLVFPSHDGVKLAFPHENETVTNIVYETCRNIVEAPRQFGKHKLTLSASWHFLFPDGRHFTPFELFNG